MMMQMMGKGGGGGGDMPTASLSDLRKDLLKLFSPFGAIAPGGIRVNLNDDGTAKGNGMINFLHLESGTAAIETLNNCMLPDGRFLRLKQYQDFGKGKSKGKGKEQIAPTVIATNPE